MITVINFVGTPEGGRFEFVGKSTDTKPTEKYSGMAVDNGSTFYEMDTQKVKSYDLDTHTWI
jgi:hypothetical protein